MRSADAARLVSLGAIWGASFVLTRIAAPVLGPVVTADARMLVGGLALVVYFQFMAGFNPEWKKWWPEYLITGVLNSGAPFFLYAYAAMSLPASLSVLLNATTPMFGAILARIYWNEALSLQRVVGLVLGVLGVGLVTRPEPGLEIPWLPVFACLLASLSYAMVGVYLKRWARPVPGKGLAVGTQMIAGLLLLPLVPLVPPPGVPGPGVLACILVLGLVCGAVAYILYFRLMADIGPTGALTVTYLVPVFGVLFGVLFLGESLGMAKLAGAALVVLGTVFVLRS